jgi:hypothetical protein
MIRGIWFPLFSLPIRSDNVAKDERLNIRISSELKEKFIDYVERNGYSQTGLIERLIKEELEKKKEAD